MDKNFRNCNPEVWGGIECTINRIKSEYKDQLSYAKHYSRNADIDSIGELGIKKLRYPVLWEHHQQSTDQDIDWSWTEKQLSKIRAKGIEPIVGLVHHGSGPSYTNLLDENFAAGLAEYAGKVATKFPWIEYYTPVNEPLTTARFSGLYGLWFPHHRSDISFARMLLNEVKAVVLSMQAIKKVNPNAKLVQTEDLAKIYSTPYLQFQANFENERRWLTFDLLCGKVNENHSMWKYFCRLGISEESLRYFLDNPCPPDIVGLNYYITSERFLDEEIRKYPACTHGGNEIQVYADVEAIRVKHDNPNGLQVLLREASERFKLPIAITEAQLNSTREEQLKWFLEVWTVCVELKKQGIDIKGVTAWSLLGAFGWNRLLTSYQMEYEPGVFDLRSGKLRKTALAHMVKRLSSNVRYDHPVIKTPGWWHRESRFPGFKYETRLISSLQVDNIQPILILGKTGTLGGAFARICNERALPYMLIGREEADITNGEQVENVIHRYNPWAVINTTGYVKVDDAESDIETCYNINARGAQILAGCCKKLAIQLLTYSSDLVFDGNKHKGYYENDQVNPLNIYGKSKALAERLVMKANPEAMVVRTSAFFGPWDNFNFIRQVINTLAADKKFFAADDIFISPTYVPDLVNVSLDLLIDKEKGIWHLANQGKVSWAQLAISAAEMAGLDANKIVVRNSSLLGWRATRPKYSVLKSSNGNLLPGLKNALRRFFDNTNTINADSEVIS